MRRHLKVRVTRKHPKIKITKEKILLRTRRILSICWALLVLLVGLDILKYSLISWINIEFLKSFFNSPIKSFFLSYFMTEVTMSWSPIAGAFISLGDVLAITEKNLAAIIMGTRGGVNSFLLITWLLMLFKWKSLKRSLWITVIQFLVTLSSTAIAAIFIFGVLKLGFMDDLSVFVADWFVLNSFFEGITGFFSHYIKLLIKSPIILWIMWLGMLVWWLFLFDKCFSFISHGKDKRILKKIVSIESSFISGFVVTALTMSLSVSVAILLPLYLRKFINRKMLMAYILGANISTLFDTLFLWIMAKSIIGIKVILAFLFAVTLWVILIMIGFKYYHKAISYLTDKILSNKIHFIIFTIIVMFTPLIFFFF